MEKEFVPYELAVKLKELGFDESSMGWYSTKGVFYEDFNAIDNINLNTLTNRGSFANAILAPTWQSAFKWFRENFGLFSSEVYDRGLDNGKLPIIHSYSFRILNLNNFKDFYGDTFKTYEEAEIACLEKLIEIVESNLNK